MLAALAGVLAFATPSCAPSGGFEEALARIDTAAPAARAGLYEAASRKAGSARDQLRLVSRARNENDAGLYRAVAERALAAFPNHPSLAYACAAARLDAGSPGEALALFDDPLAPGDEPELYALAWISEARIALREGRMPPDPGPASLGLVAEALRAPEPLLVAACFALGRSDVFLAERYLDAASSLGASAPELAWELGRFDLVLAAPLPADPEPGTPEAGRSARAIDLARRADAALMSGDIELSRRLHLALLDEAPASSWKSWETLALLAEGWRPDLDASHPERAKLLGPVDPEELAYRDARLASGFGELPEVALARAARLSRTGEAVEAMLLASSLGKRPDALLISAAARLRGGDPSRAALDALAALEIDPDDPEVLDAALSMLVRSGEPWAAVLAARRALSASAGGEAGWFAGALEAVATGRLDAAIDIIEARGVLDGGYASTACLALLLRETGRRREAADRWSLAARESSDTGDKTRFLVEEARDLIASGDSAAAKAVLTVALDLTPGSIEAASLMAAASRP
ncbi:MAG: hypothetical protein JXA15_10910 [Spirochaetales bacterium]|nr:hypothetical protein [Spirochaetales bacterium]